MHETSQPHAIGMSYAVFLVQCIKIRPTASASGKLKQAHKMLSISSRLAEEMEMIYNRWSRVRISDPELKRLVQMAIGAKSAKGWGGGRLFDI